MKKVLIAFIAVALLGVFATPGFALLRKDIARFKGKVLAKHEDKNQVTIFNESAGADMVFDIKPTDLAKINAKDLVYVVYKVDVNAITMIRVEEAAPAAEPESVPTQRARRY